MVPVSVERNGVRAESHVYSPNAASLLLYDPAAAYRMGLYGRNKRGETGSWLWKKKKKTQNVSLRDKTQLSKPAGEHRDTLAMGLLYNHKHIKEDSCSAEHGKVTSSFYLSYNKRDENVAKSQYAIQCYCLWSILWSKSIEAVFILYNAPATIHQ